MKNEINLFISKWTKYFKGIELPITYYYSDEVNENEILNSENTDRCLIGNLDQVRKGKTYVFNLKTPGCPGGKRYSGFTDKLRNNFEEFLSCGIPGKFEGERYKKNTDLVKTYMKDLSPIKAPAEFLIFKRIDKLGDHIPEAVIFFAGGDVIAGLFTLANFDYPGPDGVTAPFSSGCASIISLPLMEAEKEMPRCVLGMFDVSARPSLPSNELTFTIPFKRFIEIVNNMDESFLITESWNKVSSRFK